MAGNVSYGTLQEALFQKNAQLATLTAQREELTARVTELTAEIAVVQQVISGLESSIAALPAIPTITSFYTYSAQVSHVYVRGTSVTFTITGTGFTNASAVRLYYLDNTGVEQTLSPTTTYTSSTSIAATASVGIGNAPFDKVRTMYISVVNGDGSYSARLPVAVINAPPTFATIADPTVAQNSTTSVTLTGTQPYSLYSTTKVYLNQTVVPATFAAVNPPTITFSIPSSLTSIVESTFVLTVETPGPGGGTSDPVTYTVGYRPPEFAALADTQVAHGASESVTLTGLTTYSFYPNSTVTLNGTAATTSFTPGNPPTIQFTIPDTITGTPNTTIAMVLTNPAPRGGTASQNFTVTYNPPTLSALVDNQVVQGQSESVTLTGTTATSLYSTSTVTASGTAITPVVFTAGATPTLKFTVPDSATTSIGATIPLVVTNPSPGGGVSTAQNLTVIHTQPAFIALTGNDVVIPFSGTKAVTLTGTSRYVFYPTSQVFVNSTTEITPVTYSAGASPTFIPTLEFTIPSSVSGTAGATVPLKVTNPSPGGGDSSTLNFTVANPTPAFTHTVDGVSRNFIFVGEDAEFVLTGTGAYSLLSTSTVSFNGTTLSSGVTFDGSGPYPTLSFTIPAASITTPGATMALTVTNPSPGGGTSSAVNFTVVNIAPAFTAPTGSALHMLQGINLTATLTGSSRYAFVQDETVVTINGVNSSPTVTVGAAPGYIPSIEFSITGAATFTVGATNTVVVTNLAIGGNGGGSASTITYTVIRNAPSFSPPGDLTIAQNASRTLTFLGGTAFSFYPDTVVHLDVGGTITDVSPTTQTDEQIIFTIPSSLTTTVGTSIVLTVENPSVGGIGGGTSTPVTFTVV
jgi:hypothetical protein